METMTKVVAMLVAGEYSEVCRFTGGARLTAAEIASAIRECPGCLVMPPTEALETLDRVAIRHTDPQKWSVVMPLWTDREGRSDLSLEATLTEADGEFCGVELDNIHVR